MPKNLGYNGYIGRNAGHINNKIALRSLKKLIKERKLDFDTIAVSGISGLLLGAPLSNAINKELVIVRKKDDKNNHSGDKVEGYSRPNRYVIVDDIISTGDTVKYIKKTLHKLHPKAKFIGVLLHDGYRITDNPYISAEQFDEDYD